MSLFTSTRSSNARQPNPIILGRGHTEPTSSSSATPIPPTNHISPMQLDGTPPWGNSNRESSKEWQHLYVLPVLLFEFLALALTRAVLPSLLLRRFQTSVYLVMGCTECVRGLLAFVSCPIFGKLSDLVGRKLCLLITVAGTCAPVCSLALYSWDAFGAEEKTISQEETALNITSTSSQEDTVWPFVLDSSWSSPESHAIVVFVVLLALSGIFSSTFTLVFAYISDTVHQRDERVSAYGLALATFGLSYTLGPMIGGYLAESNTRLVFVSSFVLTILDLVYIYAFLPESRVVSSSMEPIVHSPLSMATEAYKVSWSPWDTLRIIAVDPFLRRVGQVAFLYYTSLWAVISTLVLYAASRFKLGPDRLGELMSALGLSTMVAEAVLVRIIVPMIGEKRSMKLGLAAFGLQCVVLGFAYESWHLFACIAFSLLGNLVYPSLSSLVSAGVQPESVGEALGAINGIKALTEGIGPLVFGSLMTLSEKSALPGWPYLLAAVIVYLAYQNVDLLPDVENEEFIPELEVKKRRQEATRLADAFATQQVKPQTLHYLDDDDDHDEYSELLGNEENGSLNMLSEVDTDGDDTTAEADRSRLPRTFAFMKRNGGKK